MFRFTLTLKAPRLTHLRDLYPRAKDNLQSRLEANAKPLIQADVQAYIAPYPGMVVYPFQFATDQSRKYYFATAGFGKYASNFGASVPYQRSDALKNSWEVEVSGGGLSFSQRLTSILTRQTPSSEFVIVVDNIAPYSVFVYGPRQVPGHRNTGWGDSLQYAIQSVIRLARVHIATEWRGAVHDAIRSL